MERIEQHTCFGGIQEVWRHSSMVLKCEMRLGIFLPPQANMNSCPVLYWLSGLTCTEQNFITKAGAQKYAAEHGIILVVCDTSPRGEAVPNDDRFNLGQGAGFYLNATQEPWVKNFHMFDYVTEELPNLVEMHFPANKTRAISGHSMGGHGALICALKKPDFYKSLSAFSPIAAPMQCPWGTSAFTAYLGDQQEAWYSWDAYALLRTAKHKLAMLVDQGEADEFLVEQLKPDLLEEACRQGGHQLP